jgi:hypothetical protein
MIYLLHYSSPQDLTHPSFDGKMIGFPVSIVNEEFLNSPEEKENTFTHRISVRIDGSTIAAWKLTAEDIVSVGFYYARKFINDALNDNLKFDSYTVSGPLVSIHSVPPARPLDWKKTPKPNNYSERIETKKRIGFGQ